MPRPRTRVKATMQPLGPWVLWPLGKYETAVTQTATRERETQTLSITVGPLSIVVQHDAWRQKA
jgi:hypothetical protein